MAQKVSPSLKRLQIDKDNKNMVIIIAVASFVTVFSLVASRALISQQRYQSRVIKEKGIAVKQLKDNITAADSLKKSYSDFVSRPDNVLGGNPTGSGEKDGDNGKIILDALPSKYDFPALTTSLEKILTDKSYKIDAITGVDDELNQQNSADPSPSSVEMPFEISVSGSYSSMQTLVSTLDRSIRPFQIQTIELSSTDTGVHAAITAKTFYQPEKSLTITTKEIK